MNKTPSSNPADQRILESTFALAEAIAAKLEPVFKRAVQSVVRRTEGLESVADQLTDLLMTYF